MKTLFALVGLVVTVLAVLGSFGVGNFVLMYSPEKITCEVDEPVKD